MHINVLNIEAVVSAVTSGLASTPQPLVVWASTVVRRALTTTGFDACARQLQIPWRNCITAREFRLMNHLQKNALGSAVGLGSDGEFRVMNPHSQSGAFYVLTPVDYAQASWLERALTEGNELVVYDVPGMNIGVIHHLTEALAAELPGRDTYLAVTLEAAFDHARRWQARLEREAKTTEGLIELAYEHEGYNVYHLKDKQAYVREGYLMRHCVGGYDLDDDRRIYSVRKDDQILATLEVMVVGPCGLLRQVRGAANTSVAPEVDAVVHEFMRTCFEPLPENDPSVVHVLQQGIVIGPRGQIMNIGAGGGGGFFAHGAGGGGGDGRVVLGVGLDGGHAGQMLVAGGNGGAGLAWADANIRSSVHLTDEMIQNLTDTQMDLLVAKLRQRGVRL